MSDQSTNLSLPFVAPAQAQKHVTVNEALLRLDALTQARVVSRTLGVQPHSPNDGALYVLPAGKTGAAWAAMADGALAYWRDGAWEEIAPRPGWRVEVLDERLALVFYDGVWRPAGPTPATHNRIDNGDFGLWRRGSTRALVSGGPTFGPDRFSLWCSQPSAQLTMTQADIAFPQAGPPTRWACRITCVAKPAGAAVRFAQALEGAGLCSGRQLTVAVWVRASRAIAPTWISVVQSFGAGGSAPVEAPLVEASGALGANWSQLVATFAAPACAGKTFGAGDALRVTVVLDGVEAGDWVELAGLRLVEGPLAPPFSPKPSEQERLACARYFTSLGSGLRGVWVSAEACDLGFSIAPPLRATPVLSLASGAPQVVQMGHGARAASGAVLLEAHAGPEGGLVRINGFTGAAPGAAALGSDPAILWAEAEL